MCMVSHSRQRLFTNATSAKRTAVKAKRQPPHDEDRSTAGRLLRRRRLSLKKFRCSTAAVYTRIRPPCPVESAGPINTTSRQRVRNSRNRSERSEVFHCLKRFHCRTFALTSPIARGVATTRLLRIFAIWCGGGGGGVSRHVPTARRCCGATPRFSRMASENTPLPVFSSSCPSSSPPPPTLVVDRCDFDEYFYNFFSAFTRTTLNVYENQGSLPIAWIF